MGRGALEKAKRLFGEAKLPFPYIPAALAPRLRALGPWCFGTRVVRRSPYDIRSYVREADAGVIDDYAVLAHDGHGVNSYALHYYLVHGSLRLFLQLSWGGVYDDPARDRRNLRRCYAEAGRLTKAVERADRRGRLENRGPVWVVASELYGSSWGVGHDLPAGAQDRPSSARPLDVLADALAWAGDPSRAPSTSAAAETRPDGTT